MKNFLFVLFFWASVTWTIGQTNSFLTGFSNVDLTQVPLLVIQDSIGFLWVGTTDGLFRYDGKEIREFRKLDNDSLSLSNNYIRSLTVDRHNNIWIGTNDGVNKYDSETETITRLDFDLDPDTGANRIHDILVDAKGRIWFGSYNGLFKYNVENDKLEHFLPGENKSNTLGNKLIWGIYEDSQSRIWLATEGGFTVFDNDDTYNFKPYYANPQNPKDLFADVVFDIRESVDGTYWLATYHGVFKLTEVGNGYNFEHFQKSNKSSHTLSDNRVFDLYAETDNVWASTFAGGLNQISLNGNTVDTIIHHREDASNDQSISFDKVHHVFRDRSNVLWVSTATGMDKVSPYVNKFKNILYDNDYPNGLSNKIIKYVLKDSYGNLWVGTNKGVNYIKAENLSEDYSVWERLESSSNLLIHDRIESIYEDERQFLWISTFAGLTYFHIPTFFYNGKTNHITAKHGLPHTFCHDIIQIKKGEYLVASNGAFSKMFFDGNPDNVRFEEYSMNKDDPNAIINNSCRDIINDVDGSFWIGTFNGLSNFITTGVEEQFINYLNDKSDTTSLSSNSIMCLYRDSKDRIWVGTRGGLNLIIKDPQGGRATFKKYGIKDGLPNDIIFSMEEADDGTFWVNTNRGLSHLDFDRKAGDIVIRTYNQLDGLVGSNAIYRSSLKDETGTTFFGAPGGINYFHPEELVSNPSPPVVVLTKLEINNEEVAIGGDVLDKSISLVDKISLKHWQKNIALEFAALDFNQPEQNHYRYHLSGVTDKIVDIGTSHRVMFNDLRAGDHVLSIWGSNNDGIWSNEPKELLISVIPPWWKTTWAYTFYILGVIGLIYGWFRYKLARYAKKIEDKIALEKMRQEERELIRMNNAADFHDELGNKITKVSLYLSLAERSISNNEVPGEWLQKIRSTLSDLSGGFRDLLWVIDPHKDSLYETALRIKEFGSDLFENTEIQFAVTGLTADLEHIQLDAQVKKNVVMIFKEAFHNGLKYAEADSIRFSVILEDEDVSLLYEDDGKGFDLKKESSGRGMKNMQMRANKINVEIKINSAAGEGTKISLIRLPHMGYA